MADPAGNVLFYGDNLDVLRRHVPAESVDLVYLDPPFNSQATYNVLFGEQDAEQAAAQIKVFEDTWRWDQAAAAAYEGIVEQGGELSRALQAFRTILGPSNMLAYLSMMAPRMIELRRVMKTTASVYLHCDPTASHYLKLLMDAIFGPTNFRNEIVWKRTNARSTDQRWPRIHDILLFYSKGQSFCFRPTVVAADRTKLPHTLITGSDGRKYQTFELTGAGVTQKGESGKPWRGLNPSAFGRHWAVSGATLDELDAGGLIHWPKGGARRGFPRRRAEEPFEEESRKITVGDAWTDIDRINQAAKERLGYPTQKPEALLERIIRASSNPGDVVLDPFCGCGTTIAVAQRLGRRWIGIDITALASSLIKTRLQDAFGDGAQFHTVGEPISQTDAAELARDDPYQFQWWALGLVGARPVDERKGADRGIDGRIYFHDEETPGAKTKQIILSVKAGHVQVQHLRDLRGVIDREGAQVGVLISLQSPTQPMRTEAASAGFYESEWGKHPRLQLLTVEELLAGDRIDMPPQQASVTFKRAPKAAAKQDEPDPLF